jgi:hypothetical protein
VFFICSADPSTAFVLVWLSDGRHILFHFPTHLTPFHKPGKIDPAVMDFNLGSAAVSGKPVRASQSFPVPPQFMRPCFSAFQPLTFPTTGPC